MGTYPMTEDDRQIQETARRFVDEDLIPWETHAEEHGGRIPDDVREGHHRKAVELGLFAMNMPRDLGGGGFTMLQQVLVSEQIGRVTNALGWCVHTPPAWAPEVVSPEQLETLDRADRSAASGTSATRSPRPAPGPTSTRSRRPPAARATGTC